MGTPLLFVKNEKCLAVVRVRQNDRRVATCELFLDCYCKILLVRQAPSLDIRQHLLGETSENPIPFIHEVLLVAGIDNGV